MRWKNIAALAILAASLIGLTGSAAAAPVNWNIISSASTIALAIPDQTLTITSSASIADGVVGTSLSIAVRALNPGTASGSAPAGWTVGNKQNVSGVLQTDTNLLGNIKFLQAQEPPDNAPTIIDGITSGSYSPLEDGGPGSMPGDFATRLYFSSGPSIGGLNIDLAFRNILYSLVSGNIPMLDGEFAANQTAFGIDNGDMAYRGRSGIGPAGPAFVALVGSGSVDIGGISSSNTSALPGTYELAPGLTPTLTVPISQSLSIPLDPNGALMLNVNVLGTIVAIHPVPEPAALGLLAVGVAMLAPVTVRRWRRRE